MASDLDIIELNGKRYDARTGHLLSIPPGGKKPTTKKRTKLAKKITVVHHGHPSNNKAHRIHVRTEKAKTLMRQAVKKPIPVKTVQHKLTAPGPEELAYRSIHKPHSKPSPERVERAQHISKSHLVNRFGAPKTSSFKLITTDLPVQPEPIPIDTEPATEPPEPLEEEQRSVWQQAIERADSHTQQRTKHLGHRHRLSLKLGVSTHVVNASAVALAAILLVGFIAYQNVPNLSMRMAAQRAGVSGALPGYQPAGFGLSGPIEYQPGRISLKFKSHSDGRAFTLHQRASDWDDTSLLKDYVVPGYPAFQTRQAAGKTVYIYGDHSATWVDNGIWYQVDGKSSHLTSDQLIRLAASM